MDFLIPIAKQAPLYVAEQQEVPWALRSYVAGGFGEGAIDISEIGHIYGGRNARPTKPILVMNKGTMSFIVGAGVAEASELEDLAYATSEKQQAIEKKRGTLRERMGLPSRQEAMDQRSEYLRWLAHDQVANPSKYPKRPKPDRSWVRRLPDASELPIWRNN